MRPSAFRLKAFLCVLTTETLFLRSNNATTFDKDKTTKNDTQYIDLIKNSRCPRDALAVGSTVKLNQTKASSRVCRVVFA